MSDRSSDEFRLRSAWRSTSGRFAVTAGSFVALLSLFHHIPVSIASLRGGIAYIAVLAVGRFGGFALERAVAFDRAASRKDDKGGEAS